jgi:hypothetical protein
MDEREIPPKYRKLYSRAKTSRKAAIRSFCLECFGYNEKEIEDCPDTRCPLYAWRMKG